MRRVRAAVAFLGFHEQDLVLGGFEDLDRLRHCRRIDPVFRVHEQPAARFDDGAGLLHLLHDAFVHELFRHVLSDRGPVVAAPEIAGERLFADDMLSGLDGRHDHGRMQHGGRADVDDVDLAVGEHFPEIAIGGCDPLLACEIDDMIAARGNRLHFGIDSMHAGVSIHVQFRDEAASDKAYSHVRHRRSPRMGRLSRHLESRTFPYSFFTNSAAGMRTRICANEAQAARIEVSRRLLAADQAETAGIGAASDNAAAINQVRGRKLSAALAMIVLTLGAGGLYLALGSPNLPGQPLAERVAEAHGGANSVQAMFARVEAHLAQHPEDGRGWEVIAPVYMRLGRYADAAKARANALRLLGPTAERQADFGEALVAVENGTVTAQAKAAFDAALALDAGNVTARFYEGLAAEQDGKPVEAAGIWRGMLDAASETAAWVPTVREALARVAPSNAAGSTAGASGSNSTTAGPQSNQDEMIRGMVERLAARLRENGSDVEGWVRLVRSYLVLGEREKAKAADADARRALKDDPDKLRRFEDEAKSLGISG